jgi:hypothetical protein
MPEVVMNEPHRSALLQLLRPALKNRRKAEELWRKFWLDRATIVWTTTQVHRAANENKTVLTEHDAQTILHDFISNHHYQYGLSWSDLVTAIQDSGLGRDIRPAENRDLVLRNILTVDAK